MPVGSLLGAARCRSSPRLARQLEAEHDRWFLWLPVLFGAGIAFYFLLPVRAARCSLRCCPPWRRWRCVSRCPRTGLAGVLSAALLTAALGLAAAKLRTEVVRAPVLQAETGPVDVYGFVELVEPRAAKGQRLTIRVTAMEKHEAHAWPGAGAHSHAGGENELLEARRRGAREGDALPAARPGAAGRP